MQLLFPNPPFRFIGSGRIYLLKNIDPDTQQILAATSSPLFLGLPFVICYGGGPGGGALPRVRTMGIIPALSASRDS